MIQTVHCMVVVKKQPDSCERFVNIAYDEIELSELEKKHSPCRAIPGVIVFDNGEYVAKQIEIDPINN